jgi:hypothetical protein
MGYYFCCSIFKTEKLKEGKGGGREKQRGMMEEKGKRGRRK